MLPCDQSEDLVSMDMGTVGRGWRCSVEGVVWVGGVQVVLGMVLKNGTQEVKVGLVLKNGIQVMEVIVLLKTGM